MKVNLLLILDVLYLLNGQKVPLPIGGIFERDSADKDAFSTAVTDYNSQADGLFELIPIVEIISIANDTDETVRLMCKLDALEVIGVYFGQFTSNHLILNAISSASQALQLPILLPTTTPSLVDTLKKEVSYIIHLKPRIEEAVAHLVLYYNWTSFTYLCNSAEGLYRFELMNSFLEANKVDDTSYDIDLRFISNIDYLSNDLKNMDKFLKNKQDKKILIDVDNMNDIRDPGRSNGWENNAKIKLTTQSVLNGIVRLGMNRKEYSYLLVGIGIEELNLNGFLYSGVSVVGFSILNPQSERVKNFIAQWNTRTKQRFMVALMNDAISLLTKNFEQVMRINQNYESYLEKITSRLKEQRFGKVINCHFLNERNTSSTTFEMRNSLVMHLPSSDVKRCGITGDLQMNKDGLRSNIDLIVSSSKSQEGLKNVGAWNNKVGINFDPAQFNKEKILDKAVNITEKVEIKKNKPIPLRLFDPHVIINEDRFVNITMRKLRVVTIINQPMTIRKLDGELDGFCIDLLRELSKMCNFTYEVYLVPDGKFGMRMPHLEKEEEIEVELPGKTGSKTVKKMKRKVQKWSGLIGEILNGNADMVVAPFTINHDRAQVLDFTEPFHTFGLSMMITKPGKQKPGIFSFLHPLNYDLWFSILLAFISVSLGLYVISIISPSEWIYSYNGSNELRLSRDYSILNSTWCAFAAFVQQGVEYMPKSSGARILSSIWWFITLILIAYYTANLTAFLTVSKRISPINEWKDLLKAGVVYGTVKSGSSNIFFDNTKIEPFKSMGENMKSESLVDTVQEGVERVLNSSGKYVFILESPMNNYHNSIEPCNTMMAGTPFGSHGYGVAMAKRSPLKKQMNQAVLTLAEAHRINHLYKKWWIERSQCDPDDVKSTPSALSLINVAGVFFILLAGLLLAICATFIEFFIASQRLRKKRIPTS